MAILGRPFHSLRGVNLTLGILLLLGVSSCVLLESLDLWERPLAFDHGTHLDIGLDCDSCHAPYASTDEPQPITEDTCMFCHEDMDADQPPERQVASLFVDGEFQAAHVTAMPEDLHFSHSKHVGAGVACNECHQGIEQNHRVDASLRPTMADCNSCHEQRDVGLERDCATCHEVLDAEHTPPTHDRNWQRVHGFMADGASDATANQCSLCHTESSCTTCHQEVPPASHNNTWRRRGHGVVASMDRASCDTCHRTDFCDRCHQEVLPVSHVGMFGAGQNTHCLGCHFPLQDESCFVCHKGTPSHLLAAPKPDDHSPGLNCRQCHGLTAPLPHVDKGDDCNTCHK